MLAPMERDALLASVSYQQPMIDSLHRNSLWYGGDVLSFPYDGCMITLRASGDVIADYQSDPPDKTMISVKDKSCHGIFYEKMKSAIADDGELARLIAAEPSPDHAFLEIHDGNAWEAFVEKGGMHVTSMELDSENYDDALYELLEEARCLAEEAVHLAEDGEADA